MTDAQYLFGLHIVAGLSYFAYFAPDWIETIRFDTEILKRKPFGNLWLALIACLGLGALSFAIRYILRRRDAQRTFGK